MLTAADLAENLVEALAALVGVLDSAGERWWSEQLQASRERIASGDAYEVDHLLTAFGGMGSLNDLVINSINGHEVAKDDWTVVNARYRDVVEDVWEQAKALQRNLQSGSQP